KAASDNKEGRIQQALISIQTGQVLSINAAATLFGVSYSTLYNRTHGSVSREEAHLSKRVLTPAQERVLIEWAIT
ncbi:hypothetical protein M422DRAFT_114568, partial [Sphaerobolus stellatus SS14]